MSSPSRTSYVPVSPADSTLETDKGNAPALSETEVRGTAGQLWPPGEHDSLIGEAEWAVYRLAIEALRGSGVPFMLGGAFGLGAYTGRWRNTKDIDFFLLPRDRDGAIQALTNAGFTDYYQKLPYDRGWIYRSTHSEVIVDLIWSTPNRRTEVDELWLANSRRTRLRDEELPVIPAEELAWIKLYVLQRDRCDWPDVINLLYSTSSWLDWNRLVQRLEEDLPLLLGVLSVFAWLCPNRVGDIPTDLRKRLGLRKPRQGGPVVDRRHVDRLDTRPWFAALQPPARLLGQ